MSHMSTLQKVRNTSMWVIIGSALLMLVAASLL